MITKEKVDAILTSRGLKLKDDIYVKKCSAYEYADESPHQEDVPNEF